MLRMSRNVPPCSPVRLPYYSVHLSLHTRAIQQWELVTETDAIFAAIAEWEGPAALVASAVASGEVEIADPATDTAGSAGNADVIFDAAAAGGVAREGCT